MKEIEKLLEKYFEGLTSNHEEEKLRDYFRQDNIPENLLIYKNLFNYYTYERKNVINNKQFDEKVINTIQYQKDITSIKTNKSLLFKLAAIAASLIIIFGSYLFFKPDTPKHKKNKIVLTSDEKFAINKTIEVLTEVSKIMNCATMSMNDLKYINKANNELKKLNYFNKYNKLVLKYLGAKS